MREKHKYPVKVYDFDAIREDKGMDAINESVSEMCTTWISYTEQNDRGELEK